MHVGALEVKRRFQEALSTGLSKFSAHPRSGIDHWVQHDLVKDEPSSLALFFLEHKDQIDKTALGDYLGDVKEANIAAMHSYVDHLDFSGMVIDEGIRHFLSGFRLPGEAQKIDR